MNSIDFTNKLLESEEPLLLIARDRILRLENALAWIGTSCIIANTPSTRECAAVALYMIDDHIPETLYELDHPRHWN